MLLYFSKSYVALFTIKNRSKGSLKLTHEKNGRTYIVTKISKSYNAGINKKDIYIYRNQSDKIKSVR